MPDYKDKGTTVDNEQPKYDINELADKWQKGTITPEERAWYEKWYHAFNDSETLLQSGSVEEINQRIYNRLNERLQQEKQFKVRRLFTIRKVAAAASILMFLAIGSYFIVYKQAPQITQNQAHDIAPGNNKAILTSNGKKYVLDSVKNGIVTRLANVTVNKTANGQIIYDAQGDNKATAMVYDTLTIPRGGQHQLVLADGSKVWLNAFTQIRYPEHFSGRDRTIELISGEAYFEVIHNDAMPFKVMVKGQTIQDIGTHFNINAYDDEPAIKTTLLEGSISVTKGNQTATLKPGQQSIIQSINNSIIIRDADTEEAIAWKNGYFRFNDEKIGSVMRQLSRWYNIDVTYQGSISAEGFNGAVSRYKNISQVLKMLEKTKVVHFKIEGRRVTVLP